MAAQKKVSSFAAEQGNTEYQGLDLVIREAELNTQLY